MAELGFVGLGAMGGRMVERLLAAGHSVTGWNRSADKGDWLRAKGMCWGESPRAVAARAEITFTMVTDEGTLWPRVLFWIGFGLAVAASAVYLWKVRREVRTP